MRHAASLLAALCAGLEGEGATAKVLAERALEVMLRARMSMTGQLAFVLVILLLHRALQALRFDTPAWARYVPGYLVGSLGAFWTIERATLLF